MRLSANTLTYMIPEICVHYNFAFGTLRHQDTSALNFSADLSGHFGTDLYETLYSCRPTLMHFVLHIAR